MSSLRIRQSATNKAYRFADYRTFDGRDITKRLLHFSDKYPTVRHFARAGNDLMVELKQETFTCPHFEPLRRRLVKAMELNGFSTDIIDAYSMFVSETYVNGMKARGLSNILDRYGSFESFVRDVGVENKAAEVKRRIDDACAETTLLFHWNFDHGSMLFSVLNNTPLHPMLRAEIDRSIGETNMFNILGMASRANREYTLYDTKGKGSGFSLAMVRKQAEKVGAQLSYDEQVPGWTRFNLVLKNDRLTLSGQIVPDGHKNETNIVSTGGGSIRLKHGLSSSTSIPHTVEENAKLFLEITVGIKEYLNALLAPLTKMSAPSNIRDILLHVGFEGMANIADSASMNAFRRSIGHLEKYIYLIENIFSDRNALMTWAVSALKWKNSPIKQEAGSLFIRNEDFRDRFLASMNTLLGYLKEKQHRLTALLPELVITDTSSENDIASTRLTTLIQDFRDIADKYINRFSPENRPSISFDLDPTIDVSLEGINEASLRSLVTELIKNAIDGAVAYKNFSKEQDSSPDISVSIGSAGPVSLSISNKGSIDFPLLRSKALSAYSEDEDKDAIILENRYDDGGSSGGVWAIQNRYSEKVYGYFMGNHNKKLRIMQAKLLENGTPHIVYRMSMSQLSELPDHDLLKIYGLTSKIAELDITLGGAGMGLKDSKADIHDHLSTRLSLSEETRDNIPYVIFSIRLDMNDISNNNITRRDERHP